MGRNISQGSFLCIILHAHLPLVRHPEYPNSLEEAWLFEAILECYLPLLDVLLRLHREGINPRLTMVVSPTLVAQLRDEFLLGRFRQYVEQLLDFCQVAARRYAKDQKRVTLLEYYQKRVRGEEDFFFQELAGDLPQAWAKLEQAGRLELITTALTHAYLPLLESMPLCVLLQIEGGLLMHQAVFGRRPEGFWLPECGFTPQLGRLLHRLGVGYTIVEGHGLVLGNPRPPYSVFAPVRLPEGLAVFAREPVVAMEVWSRNTGYPAHPVYREFHRDLAGEIEPRWRGPFALPDGSFRPSGIKIYAIGTKNGDKPLYNPRVAFRQACLHARRFLENRRRQFQGLRECLASPVVVAPYDAELFGHWWFEGPYFLEEIWRRGVAIGDFSLATPSDYLRHHPEAYLSTPEVSSWGAGGYHQVWLSQSNDWVLPALSRSWQNLLEAWRRRTCPLSNIRQALRELLLAQSSDWPFMIYWNRQAKYAETRLRQHLAAVDRLLQSKSGKKFLEERLQRWPFPPEWLVDRLLDLLAEESC